MANWQSLGRLSVLLLISVYLNPILSVPCYYLDGSRAAPDDIQACNLNATGGGVHSACCKIQNQDACLSTGLCLNTMAREWSHFLWSTGCTDPTFQDPACPQYCRTSGLDNARLQNCNDTYYCCAQWNIRLDQSICCNSSFPLNGEIGIVTRQIYAKDANLSSTPDSTLSSTLNTPSPTPSSTYSLTSGNTPSSTPGYTPPSNNDTITTCSNLDIPTRAIVGLSVEGAALLIAFAVLAYALRSRHILHEEVNRLNGALTASGSGYTGQALPYPYEMSQAPLNPHELLALPEPSELHGDMRVSRRVSGANQK
ncbi:hypothetical protein F5Y10DRAFT_198389 [Nemania abortiva]|nr:hypothetical protein F5Y10DRAFT_198389 [Nemania abortiva]